MTDFYISNTEQLMWGIIFFRDFKLCMQTLSPSMQHNTSQTNIDWTFFGLISEIDSKKIFSYDWQYQHCIFMVCAYIQDFICYNNHVLIGLHFIFQTSMQGETEDPF